jgi:hypothetical protein
MRKFFTPTATLVCLLFCLSLAPQVMAQSKAQLDRLYERMGRTYYAGRVAEAPELAERHLNADIGATPIPVSPIAAARRSQPSLVANQIRAAHLPHALCRIARSDRLATPL